MVEATLEKELGGLGIGEWTTPKGGYFISFESMEGCAKKIVAMAKEAGVVMTGAGATYHMAKTQKTAISVLLRLSLQLMSWKRLRRFSLSA